MASRTVYDPEIPVNIHDLGLIYDVEIQGNARVFIRMTLTAPNCPPPAFYPARWRAAPVP